MVYLPGVIKILPYPTRSFIPKKTTYKTVLKLIKSFLATEKNPQSYINNQPLAQLNSSLSLSGTIAQSKRKVIAAE